MLFEVNCHAMLHESKMRLVVGRLYVLYVIICLESCCLAMQLLLQRFSCFDNLWPGT